MRLPALLAVACLGIPLVAQSSLTIPAPFATTEATSSSTYPWNYTNTTGGMIIQQVYDSTNFTSASVNFPVLITRLRTRANTNATCAGRAYNNATVSLSTAAVDHLAVTNSFAGNRGVDFAQVYQGPVTVQPIATGTTPNAFYVDIVFTTPFRYDPAAGDLMVEITHDGTITGGTSASVDLATTTTAPNLCSRVWSITSATATTAASVQPELGMVIQLDYTPVTGLYAGFTASTTRGASPLTVNFTDSSFTSTPGGITSWAWDFNGDGTTDSTLQNPTHVFGCGTSTVSLTVTDGVFPSNTLTRTGYVETDIVTPRFSYALLSAGVLQFTDTSVPTPTSWAWDLNGDSITDSTLQNPVFAYPTGCNSVNVSLTVSRNCRGPYTVARPVVTSNSLTTTAAGGNGTSSTTIVGNLFDVQVTNPAGINVCALEVRPYSVTTAFNLELYVTPDTYVGKQTVPGAWRLVATGSGVSGGGTSTTSTNVLVPLSNSVYLAPGNQALAVMLRPAAGGSMFIAYSNGPLGPFSNGDLTVCPNPTTAPGQSMTTLFTAAGIASRVWNGVIHYSPVNTTGEAGYGFFGPGCNGTLGTSTLTATNLPRLGQSLGVTVANMPASAGIMNLGLSRTASVFGPLPLDLAAFGAPGCTARVSADVSTLIAGTGSQATFTLAIPNTVGLIGLPFYNQCFVIDPTANLLGGILSDAAAGILGN